MESGRSAFSRGHSNRRSVSRSRALVGSSREALSQRFTRSEPLGDGEERQAGRGQNRSFSPFSARGGGLSSRAGGRDPHRSQLLRKQSRNVCAIPSFENRGYS